MDQGAIYPRATQGEMLEELVKNIYETVEGRLSVDQKPVGKTRIIFLNLF